MISGPKSYLGRFPLRKKKTEILVGAKVEFPIGKTLFHLIVKPGTSRCPTMDMELVQTTRNVNGTRHSVRKFQPRKRAHLFRFSTLSGNFFSVTNPRNVFDLPPNRKFRKFGLNGKRPGTFEKPASFRRLVNGEAYIQEGLEKKVLRDKL